MRRAPVDGTLADPLAGGDEAEPGAPYLAAALAIGLLALVLYALHEPPSW